MSEINPNVNITSGQTMDTAESGAVDMGNGGGVTFDSLEGAGVAPQPNAKKLNTKTERETVEAEKAAPATKEAETATAATPKAEKVEAAAAPVVVEEPKSYKLKTVAGREVDVPLDAKVTKKIDGVDQEVSIKEALDQYAGKVAYDKRFTELDQRDKAYQKDKSETEAQLTGVLQKAYKNDVIGSLLDIVKIAGMDPAPVFESIKTEIFGDMQKYMNMDDAQRELHLVKKENEFLKRSKASDEQSKVDKQAHEELTQQVDKLRDTLKVTDQWMKEAESTIGSNPEAYKSFDNPKGRVELADALQRWDLASKALGMIDPDYATDEDMVEVAARKLQGFDGDAQAASKILSVKLKLTSRGPAAQVLENLSKKVEQGKKATSRDDEISTPTTASDDDFDPRGWGRI